jgi:hypothetical protein
MDLNEIRTACQENQELFICFVNILFPDEKPGFCNEDFINQMEEDARAGKVFIGDVPFPTVDQKISAYNAAVKHLEDTEYIKQRRSEFLKLGDGDMTEALAFQLDYIYHNGVDAWKADIVKPVKDKYPKNNG